MPTGHADQPLVSIIIPTRNSAGTLATCLAAVMNQTYKNKEVIIVDSLSNDRTLEITKRYPVEVVKADAHMTKARNIGFRHASGKYVLHLDSDMILDPETLEKCVTLCQNGADAVAMPQIFLGSGLWGRCREMEFRLYLGYKHLSVSRFVSRVAMEVIGGYDEKLISGEDWDVTQRLRAQGYTIETAETIVIHGWGRINLLMLVRKSYKYGKTVRPYTIKHRKAALHQWGPARFIFLFREGMKKYPRYVLGILVLKTIEFVSGFLGVLASWIEKPAKS